MKIPKKAKRVFKGVIFDVYQWPQKMFDGSVETFEALKRIDSVNVIATTGKRILISYESQPTKPLSYTLFGGRMEHGETPLASAKRELLEETGTASKQWQLYKTYAQIPKIEWSLRVFIAKECEQIAEQALDAGEKITVTNVSFDEFIDIASSPHFWCTEISLDILRMRQSRKEMRNFKRLLFNK